MKKKIIILIFLILAIIVGGYTLFLNIFYKEGNNNGESEYTEDFHEYKCPYVKKYDSSNTNFEFEAYYYFAYDKTGLLNGRKVETYKFKDVDSYNNFEYSKYNPSVIPNEQNFDSKKFIKTYIIGMMIKMDTNNINDYIKKINDYGYKCKKIR